MKNLVQLSRYIRFQLSQLKAQNGHHAFENMCRQFARLRISDRILPATGPVSAGGDQGKDFESFKTYLEERQIPFTFLATAPNEKLVFACSLAKVLQNKIKTDVKTICSGQQHIDSIYFFIEQDLPVAKRHDLQNWAKQSHGVHLEILDGQALAEALTDPEIFWIAEEFLGVSADQYPQPQESKSRYTRIRKHWFESGAVPYNYADFFEVKYGLRHATFTNAAKPDLGNWIKNIEHFLGPHVPDQLRRKAMYEIAVAALRGQNNLECVTK